MKHASFIKLHSNMTHPCLHFHFLMYSRDAGRSVEDCSTNMTEKMSKKKLVSSKSMLICRNYSLMY